MFFQPINTFLREALLPSVSYGACAGVAQVVRLVCALRYQGELWGLWESGTLKIVIPVENYPPKRFFWLVLYHPLSGVGVLISGNEILTNIYINLEVVNSGDHDSL